MRGSQIAGPAFVHLQAPTPTATSVIFYLLATMDFPRYQAQMCASDMRLSLNFAAKAEITLPLGK